MKRIKNSNSYSVEVGIQGNRIIIEPNESIVVEENVNVDAPSGVFVTPQAVMLDSRVNKFSNVLMG
mgnify:CR=1 FL=1